MVFLGSTFDRSEGEFSSVEMLFEKSAQILQGFLYAEKALRICKLNQVKGLNIYCTIFQACPSNRTNIILELKELSLSAQPIGLQFTSRII